MWQPYPHRFIKPRPNAHLSGKASEHRAYSGSQISRIHLHPSCVQYRVELGTTPYHNRCTPLDLIHNSFAVFLMNYFCQKKESETETHSIRPRYHTISTFHNQPIPCPSSSLHVGVQLVNTWKSGFMKAAAIC